MIQKNKKIIAFAGRQRSGKTHLAKLLEKEKGAKIYTIANYLKQLCCDLIGINSISELNDLKNSKKELWIEPQCVEWGIKIEKVTGISSSKIYSELKKYRTIKDVRELLQVIGTNIIRKYYPNWHIDQLIKDVMSSDDELIAIDDVRFPNEYKAISEIGGEIFFIVRTVNVTKDMISNHQSETALMWFNFPNNKVILNVADTYTMDNLFLSAYNNNFTNDDNRLLLSSQFEALSNNPLIYEDLKCRIR